MGWRGRGCGKRHGDAGKLSRVCSCRSPTTYWLRPHKKKTKPPDTRIRGGTRAICVCWERACAHAHGPMAGIRTASRLHTGTAASQAEKTRDRAGAAARGERASKKHGGRSPTGSGAQRWGIAQGAPDCGAVPQTTRPRRRLRTHRSASTRTVAAETRARASARDKKRYARRGAKAHPRESQRRGDKGARGAQKRQGSHARLPTPRARISSSAPSASSRRARPRSPRISRARGASRPAA